MMCLQLIVQLRSDKSEFQQGRQAIQLPSRARDQYAASQKSPYVIDVFHGSTGFPALAPASLMLPLTNYVAASVKHWFVYGSICGVLM
jgi:hypothetical protein